MYSKINTAMHAKICEEKVLVLVSQSSLVITLADFLIEKLQ